MRIGLAIASLTCGLLLSEITLTRIFSVTLMYHFAFLVLSVTLCGLSAGGLLHYLIQDRRRPPVAWYAAGAAFSLPLTTFVSLSLPISPYSLEKADLAGLLLVVTLSIIPFLFCGLYLASLYSAQQSRAGRIYAFDLAGAASGCVAAIFLLELLGAPAMPWLAAFLFLGAAWLLPRHYSSSSARWAGAALCLFLAGGWNGGWLKIEYVKGRPESAVEFEKWNAFSRVAVLQAPQGRLVQIDADAATEILSQEWVSDHGQTLLQQITGVVYQLRRQGEVLVIGPGGGRDIVAARLAGHRVTGVEINPIIVEDLMRHRYRDLSGDLYDTPGVEVVVSDGRSFLERSRRSYDVIQANAVDTWAATSAGGFTLSESYLYTVEAFESYLSRLNEEGILTLGRWELEPPQQMLRVIALALEAMERASIANPEKKIFLILDPAYTQGGGTPGVVLIKKTDFTDKELALLHRVAEGNGYQIPFSPSSGHETTFAALIRSADRSGFFARYPLDVRPTTDDRPFFFFTLKWRDLATVWRTPEEARKNNSGLFLLMAMFFFMLLLTVCWFVLPLLLSGADSIGVPAGAFFLCIGLGFMMAEAALIQKTVLFLGHPTYAFTVVVAGVLLGAGCGSLLTGRVAERGLASAMTRSALLVSVLTALIAWGLPFWLSLGFSWSLEARMAWLMIPLFLIGMVLGRLFPLGLRRLRKVEVPWAWALNGIASVLGSILAVILAMGFGFSRVLLAAAFLYLLASLLSLRWVDNRA